MSDKPIILRGGDLLGGDWGDGTILAPDAEITFAPNMKVRDADGNVIGTAEGEVDEDGRVILTCTVDKLPEGM